MKKLFGRHASEASLQKLMRLRTETLGRLQALKDELESVAEDNLPRVAEEGDESDSSDAGDGGPFGQKGTITDDPEEHARVRVHIMLKRVAMESLKFTMLEDEISKIQTNRKPSSYSVEQFLVDLNTNPTLRDLSKAVGTLERNASVEPETSSSMGLESEPLSIFEVLKQKVVRYFRNPNEASFYEALLRNSENKEAMVVERFVERFCEAVHQSQPPPDVRPFLWELRDFMVKRHALAKDHEELIDIALEDFVFPKIYHQCMFVVARPEEDQILYDQCVRYSHVSQAEMFIDPEHRSTELVPYAIPISQLRATHFATTPLKKLYGILSAAESVYKIVEELSPGSLLGGDKFLDIWMYVVLKANVPQLATMVAFIREYVSEEYFKTELGYYFTACELAANFLQELSSAKLSIRRGIIDRPFLVCEHGRWKALCAKEEHLDLISECERLAGYKMYVVKAWLLDPGALYSTLVVPTDDLSDVIYVARVKANKQTNIMEQAILETAFLRPPAGCGLTHVMTVFGALVIAESLDPFLSVGHKVVEVPGGDLEKHEGRIRLRFALEMVEHNQDHQAPDGSGGPIEQQQLHHLYGTPLNMSLRQSVKLLLLEVQTTLFLLGSYPADSKLDGEAGPVTMESVRAYQHHLQETCDAAPRDESFISGIVTPTFVQLIRQQLTECHRRLELLGFPFEGEPWKNPRGFSRLVKIFQRACRIYPDGCLGSRTITRLHTWLGDDEEEANLRPSHLFSLLCVCVCV